MAITKGSKRAAGLFWERIWGVGEGRFLYVRTLGGWRYYLSKGVRDPLWWVARCKGSVRQFVGKATSLEKAARMARETELV